MIHKVLSLIAHQLNQYIPANGGESVVVLGNITLSDSPNQNTLNNRVVVSVVNIEEESTLKNSPHFMKRDAGVSYHHPPVFLNLYVLFCAHFPNDYYTSLEHLSAVIEFFQHRKTFNLQSPFPTTLILQTSRMWRLLLPLTCLP
jgi:hypothetical protein